MGKSVKTPPPKVTQAIASPAPPSVLALTQGLLVSGALNVLLLTLLVALMVKETPPLAFASFRDASSTPLRGPLKSATMAFLESIATKRFEEIVPFLNSQEPLEEGISKRDLTLAWIVVAHHFDLRRALFGLSKPISDRIVRVKVQDKMWELRLFPKLPEKHLESITHFLEKEKWPFDAEGLYALLKQGIRDPSLVEAFLWTKEYLLIERLLKETGLDVRPDEVVNRLLAHSWSLEMWRFPSVEKLYPLFDVEKPKVTAPKEITTKTVTPPKAVTKSSLKSYTIQEGDSLWKIAKKHGVTVDALKAKNPQLSTTLKPGTKIEIPST